MFDYQSEDNLKKGSKKVSKLQASIRAATESGLSSYLE